VIAKPAPNQGAGHGAEPRSQQDCAALPVGQRPFLGQRRGDVANQKEIEEIEQIGDIGGADQLPLIGRQPLLPFQQLDHRLLPARYGPSRVTAIIRQQKRYRQPPPPATAEIAALPPGLFENDRPSDSRIPS